MTIKASVCDLFAAVPFPDRETQSLPSSEGEPHGEPV